MKTTGRFVLFFGQKKKNVLQSSPYATSGVTISYLKKQKPEEDLLGLKFIGFAAIQLAQTAASDHFLTQKK